MAWNPSPKVAVARKFAQDFDADIVIVLAYNMGKRTMETTSFGKTTKLCDRAKEMADGLWEDALAVYSDTE